MERPHRDLDGERDQEGCEDRSLEDIAVGALVPPGLQLEDVERADASGVVVRLIGGDDADQHQQRPDQRVDEELDRREDAVFRSPNTDEQGHRDKYEFPEDVEDEEVERHEDAEHTGLQQEHGDVVLTSPVVDRIPRPDDRDDPDEGRQNDQEKRDTVDTHPVRNAELREPLDVLGVLKLRVLVEVLQHPEREQETDHGRDKRNQARLLSLDRTEGEDQHRADQGRVCRHAQNGQVVHNCLLPPTGRDR